MDCIILSLKEFSNRFTILAIRRTTLSVDPLSMMKSDITLHLHIALHFVCPKKIEKFTGTHARTHASAHTRRGRDKLGEGVNL